MDDLETCGKCMGSGYGGHPDSGAVCADCNGSGGVAQLTYTPAPFSHTVKAGEVAKISPEQLDKWVQGTYGRPTPTAQE